MSLVRNYDKIKLFYVLLYRRDTYSKKVINKIGNTSCYGVHGCLENNNYFGLVLNWIKRILVLISRNEDSLCRGRLATRLANNLKRLNAKLDAVCRLDDDPVR